MIKQLLHNKLGGT